MSSGNRVKIGIIGGTGVGDPNLLENRTEKEVDTPFGKPSDALVIGQIKGVDCVTLARHGRKHSINPPSVNYRANMWALKAEGCTCVVTTTAVGSLQENIHPGEVVILDQFIDWTRNRKLTFFDCSAETPLKGVCYVPMAQPYCSHLREILIDVTKNQGCSFHDRGTVVVIEGPRFSTRAESFMFRSFGASLIGMTAVPEAQLAVELGLPYASIGLVTDYDCWKDDELGLQVNVELVLQCLKKSADLAKNIILEAIPRIAAKNWDPICEQYKDVVNKSIILHQ